MNNYYNHIWRIFNILLLAILAVACTGRKEKAERSGLIPEEDFVTLLTEIHIADGLLIIPKIRNLYEQSDSIRNYTEIIQSHGYTMEAMDKTIRYYFIKKPKKLIKIYDEVLVRLSDLEAFYEKDAGVESNLWMGDSLYYFPSANDSLIFDHKFESFGYYTLNFTLTLYPDDQSVNPRFVTYFCHPDSIETGKRDYYTSLPFMKDGRPHNYSFFRKPVSPDYTYLRGFFIDSGNQLLNVERHLKIEKIYLNFLPSAR